MGYAQKEENIHILLFHIVYSPSKLKRNSLINLFWTNSRQVGTSDPLFADHIFFVLTYILVIASFERNEISRLNRVCSLIMYHNYVH